jgi:predicted nucleic acid-binding protein
MTRVIIDTNVYIAFMNDERYADIVLGPNVVRHMSSVVHMELEAGAATKSAQRTVTQLARSFERVGRLVPPSAKAWRSAGSILRRVRASGREVRRASLVNDVLIALTARDIGATIVTNDRSDFAVLRKHIDFSWTAADGA